MSRLVSSLRDSTGTSLLLSISIMIFSKCCITVSAKTAAALVMPQLQVTKWYRIGRASNHLAPFGWAHPQLAPDLCWVPRMLFQGAIWDAAAHGSTTSSWSNHDDPSIVSFLQERHCLRAAVQWCRLQDAAGRWAAGAWAARLSHRGPKQFNALAGNTPCDMPRLCVSWEMTMDDLPNLGPNLNAESLQFLSSKCRTCHDTSRQNCGIEPWGEDFVQVPWHKKIHLESESLLDGVPTLTIYWPCSLLWLHYSHYSCCTLLSVPRVKLWGGHAKGELFTKHVKSSETRGREYANNLYRVQLLKQQLAWLCQSAKSGVSSS